MANLAIKGHQKRGSEVIEILEMLGYIDKHNYSADCDSLCFYGDKSTNIVYYDWVNSCYEDKNILVFTLEQFLAQFPYKVGDKVYYDNKVCDVIEMLWNSNLNTISYGVYDGKMKNLTITEDLKPYNKATKEFYNKYCVSCGSQRCTSEDEWLEGCEYYKKEKDLDWHPTDYLEFENNDDTWADEVEVNLGNNHEIQVRDNKTFIVRKKPQYPKTYEECRKLSELNCNPYSEIILSNIPIHEFCKLIVARNIYWKIVGDQMGLGKPWKPDYTNPNIDLYVIITICNRLEKAKYGYGFQHCILTFPTAEIRDTFFENFKGLIETCKEMI